MKETTAQISGQKLKLISLNTIIVGTGAAGYNTADRLWQYGQKDIAIVTEHINAGTSRNTGSDKQTYYKLSLCGEDPDSVRSMAKVLFDGQCVDGDHALCEAALSTQSFLKLVELGVPFPKNRYGEYVGYKTDHDPSRRATSVGPYTSKKMTECLEKAITEKNIKVFDNLQVIRILKKDDKCVGLLCVRLDECLDDERYVAFNAANVVMATGGPAGIYANSVYPYGHYGASGVAYEAGVIGKNLTEWQFGLASVAPRWNVSGTYMQVLPKFVSTDSEGNDPHEFLNDFFTDRYDMLSKIFLKGYQWPFDVRKVATGSSIIDILVYIESSKGRRVFLDFRENPYNEEIDFNKLSNEAKDYLTKAKATFGKPIDRLKQMNEPAISFYKDKQVDLMKEPLEIALCAQHNNGGLAVNSWWQTNLDGLFAAGEAAGTHGVYRPGGTALNAGQVGSTRVAQYVAKKRTQDALDDGEYLKEVEEEIKEYIEIGNNCLTNQDTVKKIFEEDTILMSKEGGAIRNSKGINELLTKISSQLEQFNKLAKIDQTIKLGKLFRLHDTLICQLVYLSAYVNYVDQGGTSRGSALYTDPKGELPFKNLDEKFRFKLSQGERTDEVQEAKYDQGKVICSWRKVRPIPQEDDFFENVWRSYRENENIY